MVCYYGWWLVPTTRADPRGSAREEEAAAAAAAAAVRYSARAQVVLTEVPAREAAIGKAKSVPGRPARELASWVFLLAINFEDSGWSRRWRPDTRDFDATSIDIEPFPFLCRNFDNH